MQNIVGLKQLRLQMGEYAEKVQQGNSFIVLKQNKPLFKIIPVDQEDQWETVVDFTTVQKQGVDLDDVLAVL